jgi:hypothetical protein
LPGRPGRPFLYGRGGRRQGRQQSGQVGHGCIEVAEGRGRVDALDAFGKFLRGQPAILVVASKQLDKLRSVGVGGTEVGLAALNVGVVLHAHRGPSYLMMGGSAGTVPLRLLLAHVEWPEDVSATTPAPA